MNGKTFKSLLKARIPDFTLLIYVIAATIGALSGGLWAALGIGAAVILFTATWAIRGKVPRPPNDLAALAFAFFLTVAAMNLQSSLPGWSWHEWARLLTIFLPLLFLLSPSVAAGAGHPKLFVVLPLAIIAGSAALAVELHTKAPLEAGMPTILAKYNRGFSYLVMLSFPVMAALWFSKKRWLIIPFVLVLLIPASMTESRSSKLALMLAIPVIVSAHFAPVLMRRLLAAGTVLAVAWPFAAREFFLNHYDLLSRIPLSWRARVEIWDYMSFRIMEHPWLGWGLGSSSSLPFKEPHGALYMFTDKPAAHPHNVMTQLWAELGLPGLALGLAFAFLMLRKISRLDPRLVPPALGAWMACFCLSLTAYDFWTDSLFAAFALTGLAFAILQKQINASQPWMAAPKARR